jgi:uncharacterized membrane protein
LRLQGAYSPFHRQVPQVPSPPHQAKILRAAISGKPYAIIELGILVLIATPALRVALAVGFFIVERDRFYVITTLLVLAVLIASFLLGTG